MLNIKEALVVEGKDDASAVKKAVRCDVIITHGYGIKETTFKRIEQAAETTGVIILTDPDFAGEKIRERIAKRVPTCKHAFISKELAMLDGDIGVENASVQTILDALEKVRTVSHCREPEFTNADLIQSDLVGGKNASYRRALIGRHLGVGYCNAKQFLGRLNHYGVTREEFNSALMALEEVENG